MDNAVDLTTAEENVVVIVENIVTPLEELTEVNSAPNETEEERIWRESREDLENIIQEARINNEQEENRIEEEEEIEREIRGEIDEVVLRKRWEAQAEAEMEEDREELARNAKNITVNRTKAVKRQAENAAKMINDSNKKFKQCEIGDSVTLKVPDVDKGTELQFI